MRAWMVAALLGAGCGDIEPLRAPQVVSADFSAGPVSPTATLSVLLSAPIDAASAVANVYLAHGEPDPALERPPPSATERARLVPGSLVVDGDTLRFTPRRALDPWGRYTFYVGPKLVAGGLELGRAVALAVETSGLDGAAPIVTLELPADGAVDVPRNLREVWLRYSRPVLDALDLTLVDDSGAAIPARVVPGPDGGIRIQLDAVLDPGRRFEVHAASDVVDGEGEPVFGDPPGFMTGDVVRTGPVVLRAFDARSSDRCAVVRFTTDDPSWSEVCVAERCADGDRARAHETAIAFGDALGADPLGFEARAWDETTRPEGDALGDLGVPSSLPLALTEVLTRPLAGRLAQQFVELQNFGAAPIPLDGLTLHTGSGANALPAATLPGGGYGLVVPSGWVDGAGGDPSPAPGTQILRLTEGHLGGRGLHVGGEPVWIEDAAGRVVTRWGGYALPLTSGQSVMRAPGSCDVAASFRPTPSGGSTPGGP